MIAGLLTLRQLLRIIDAVPTIFRNVFPARLIESGCAVITITGLAQHQSWQQKTMPAVEQVRPGVWSIPVAFPDNPLRYTLSYLLQGSGGAVLVDPGWDSDAGWQQLLDGLHTAGLTPQELTGIAVSHYHPDHLGMAERLKAASGAWLGLGKDERLWGEDPRNVEEFLAADRARFAHWGIPEHRLAEICLTPGIWAKSRHAPEPDLRFADGEQLPVPGLAVRAVATPGHTPGHLCFLDESNSLLLTGDHILPRITPHISLESFGSPNPLAEYYHSLARVDLPGDLEVLPGHEYRFSGLSERIAQITAHTDQRSAEVREVLRENNPRTVWDVAQSLTWSRGWESLRRFTLRLALAETASHLVYLESRGEAVGVPVRAAE